MSNTASLKKEYVERIAPALKSQFQYSSAMQVPVLKKIVINQGLGMAVADKKIIEVAINEMTAITGQKAVATISRKAIVTREKMRIEFNEEKKVITISTPGKNTVEISDDDKHIKLTDQNKNEIVMNSSGISLSSAKDITLKAKGAITIDATSKISATAKQDVSLEGLNVNMQAKVSATVKGNAMAELSASGQTTVKGAMVMIN